MEKESCSKCKFWLSRYDDLEIDESENGAGYGPLELMQMKDVGMCRRYPPVAVEHEEDHGFYSFNGDATDFFEFVHTTPDDWCGEFVMKPNVERNRLDGLPASPVHGSVWPQGEK